MENTAPCFSHVTVHGWDERLNVNVSLNYLTDSVAYAFDRCEELHPDVRITGHTLHIN